MDVDTEEKKTIIKPKTSSVGDKFDLDEVYAELGAFGRFQITNYFFICLAIIIYSMYLLNYIFTSGDLNYRCKIENCDNTGIDGVNNVFIPAWLTNAVPFKNAKPIKCKKFQITQPNITAEQCMSPDYFNRSQELTCSDFLYETEEVTIANNFNLTCDENQWKLASIGSINNIGLFVFMPLTGYISDKYGRRNILIFGMLCCGIFGMLKSFATSYTMFAIFEFLDAALGSGINVSVFILGMELIGPKQRVLGSTLTSTCFSFGGVLLGLIAWATKDYQIMLRIIYAPAFLIIFYYWIVPESVRWLMIAGHKKKGVEILRGAAKTNKVTFSDRTLQILDEQFNLQDAIEMSSKISTNGTGSAAADEERQILNGGVGDGTQTGDDGKKKDSEIMQILKSRVMMLRILNCSFCWLTNTFVFYGLSLNSVSMAGNKYVNFIVASLAEIPGYITTALILNRFGRRWCLCVTLTLAGLACILTEFTPIEYPILRLIVFLFGKCAITISFTIIYVYTAEIYPTTMRNGLMSTCSMIGRVGSMLAPQTPLLGRIFFPQLPLILFAGTAITSGLLILQMPETLNTKLPDTIEEAENLGKKSSNRVVD